MSDGTTESVPEPGAQGWYPVPGEPNYQRYWDGEAWTAHRYWGGDGPQRDATGSEPKAPERSLRGELHHETTTPPNITVAPLAVGTILAAVFLAFIVLGILPWETLLFVLAVLLIVLALRWSQTRQRPDR